MLVQLLAQRNIPLIEDDLYGNLSFGPTRPRTAKSFDKQGLVLLVDSFSKTLAPGYRIGWAAPGRFRAQVHHLRHVSSCANPAVTQLAIADYLATGGYERHLRRLRRTYAELVQRVSESVARHFPEGTRVTRPQGGHILWVELPVGIDALELHRQALEFGVSIAPGPIFSPHQQFRNYVRLNCGNPWSDRVDQAIAKLGRAAKNLGSKAIK
jgi:DNA-binding transcriptional MocR family regulator